MAMNKIHNFFYRIIRYSKSSLPSWIIFNFDVIICLISILLAYFLRFNFKIPDEYSSILSLSIVILLGSRIITFFIGRTYAMIVRHVGISDLTRMIFILLMGSAFALCFNFINYKISGKLFIPLSVIIMEFFITAYLMTASRLIIKFIYIEFKTKSKKRTNVLIYGVDELAVATKRALDLDVETSYRVIGFLDDKKKNQRKNLEGVKIFPLQMLSILSEKHEVDNLIISKNYLPPAKKSEIIEICLNHNIKVLTVPRIKNWINGDFSARKLKQINIEDLLEREPINLDSTEVRSQLKNKTILVTGAAGSIGSEIVRQISSYEPKKVLLLDQAETPLHSLELELSEKCYFNDYDIIIGDVCNQSRINRIFEKYNIDVIYHAAAYKHVPMMEGNPSEAIHNNVIGTRILADLAVKYNVGKFIMISTDKAVNPTNIMGTSKRIAEMYTQSLDNISNTSFITTRFGNVLGSNGSAIPLFKKQIDQGGPVTVTHPEVTRFFMTIPEACQLVLEASAMGKGGEVFIFDMGKSIRISDIARNMIRLSGLQVGKDIEIKYTGLRPGEKLYEELLCTSENSLTTYHPKIMIAKVAKTDFNLVSAYINQFEKLIKNQNNIEIVRLMKKMVPEFKSQNSAYEVLDNINSSLPTSNISIN
jgi:FlaA1/EpsC-like NDP-sugar epimerase